MQGLPCECTRIPVRNPQLSWSLATAHIHLKASSVVENSKWLKSCHRFRPAVNTSPGHRRRSRMVISRASWPNLPSTLLLYRNTEHGRKTLCESRQGRPKRKHLICEHVLPILIALCKDFHQIPSTGLWNWLQCRVHGNSILRRISCSPTLKHQQLHLEMNSLAAMKLLLMWVKILWTTCAIFWMPNSMSPVFLSS